MFHGDRWAKVFTGALGENTEAGLECLRTLVPVVQTIPGALFGHSAARQLEKMLHESALKSAGAQDKGAKEAVEYSTRFITLLVEKNQFKYIDSVLQHIEAAVNKQKGILDVTAESAIAPDSAFTEELRRMIMQRTGSENIKIKWKLAPELLGGYRLRIGGLNVDASLKGQLKKMKTDLEEAVLAAASGGVGVITP